MVDPGGLERRVPVAIPERLELDPSPTPRQENGCLAEPARDPF
jgi:hypothetical protein